MDSDEQTTAYLAGDLSARVDPAERRELDAVRAVLNDPAVWTDPPPGLQERIVGAITTADDSERGIKRRSRRIRFTVLGAAAAVLVTAALTLGLRHDASRPAVEYAASLNGTRLAPGVSGKVTLTRTTSGWKIRLHAKGLPRLDNGAFYEAWLKSDGAVLVPIGTFNQADDVTLWSGVTPSSYPTLTVTRQRAGELTSSGQVVLAGITRRTH